MTRDEELNAINEAIATGKLRRITPEEALEYTLRQAFRTAEESRERMKRVNAAVGNATARLKRERAYAKGESLQ